MIGHRRAAAALHALPEEDRQWLLGELPESERKILNQLLGELTELGFDAGCTSQPAVTVMSRVGAGNTAGLSSSADIVRNASARELIVLLEHEPSSLIAQVLRIEEWPWKQAFLQGLPHLRRDRIVAMADQMPPLGSSIRSCLLDGIAKRLGAGGDSGATGVPADRMQSALPPYRQAFSALLKKVTRWIR